MAKECFTRDFPPVFSRKIWRGQGNKRQQQQQVDGQNNIVLKMGTQIFSLNIRELFEVLKQCKIIRILIKIRIIQI